MRNRFPVTLWLTLVALVAALALPARANTWPLPPPGSRLVGQNQFHVVQDDGGSLEAIAKKYNVGFLALLLPRLRRLLRHLLLLQLRLAVRRTLTSRTSAVTKLK